MTRNILRALLSLVLIASGCASTPHALANNQVAVAGAAYGDFMRDCESQSNTSPDIYAEVDLGPMPLPISLQVDGPEPQRGPSPLEVDAGLAYTQRVMRVLSCRHEMAKRANMALDSKRLPSEAEKRAYDYVNEIHDYMHPRLVVTATRLHVRRHPGDIDKRPIDTLEMGDVVYFCGGHLGGTKVEGGEVVWYWIDDSGDCDRSKPKKFIASKEIENGKEHWLVRWHDYDMRFAKYRHNEGRKSGDAQQERRFGTRVRVGGDIDILPLESDHALLALIGECLAGVTISKMTRGSLQAEVLKKSGGSATLASITSYLGGAAYGTAVAVPASLSTGVPLTDQYAGVLLGSAAARVLPLVPPTDVVFGAAVCVGFRYMNGNARLGGT